VVSAPFPTGNNPYDMAFDGTAVWIANSGSPTLTRIDTASQIDTNPKSSLGHAASSIVFDGGQLWIAEFGAFQAIDPATGAYAGVATSSGASVGNLTFDGQRVWGSALNSVQAIDHSVSSAPSSGNSPGVTTQSPILFDGSVIWVGTATGVRAFAP
jgi:hypothetical protein